MRGWGGRHEGFAPGPGSAGAGTAPSGFLGDKFVAKTQILLSRAGPKHSARYSGSPASSPALLDALELVGIWWSLRSPGSCAWAPMGTAAPGGGRSWSGWKDPFAQVELCTEGLIFGFSRCSPQPRGLGVFSVCPGGDFILLQVPGRLRERWEVALWMRSREGLQHNSGI